MAVAYLIDNAGIDDLEEILVIEAEAFITPWHRDSLISALQRPNSIFIAAREQGRLIGYALSWLVSDEMHILKLAVDKNYQRLGWGRQLIEESVRRAQMENAAIAWLEVRPSNHAALAMYKTCGFTTAFRRKKYYSDTGEDAIILVRHLT